MNYRNESEVMYAIRKFLDEHQIPFNVEEKSQYTNYIYDFYLPEGLKNAKLPLGKGYVKYEIGEPVAIEVKGRLLFDTIQRYVTLFTEELAPKKEVSKKETPKKETAKKETVKKEAPKKESPKKEVSEKEVKEEVSTEPVVAKKEEKLVEVTSETKEACEKFLYDVLKTMGMEVKITSDIDEDGTLCIDMEGENMGILIGKRGQTLDSLQYLTNRVANKTQDGYVRVKLDTENYRQRRKETLENLAKNIAHKVKRTKKSVSLEPMNPYERRIIHSALQADRYVSTHSEGEEPYRRVVVTLNRK